MLLTVDIGNTETVLGLFQKEILTAHWRLSSKIPRTPDECWILFKMWCDSASIPVTEVHGVVISSVVPALSSVFKNVAVHYLKCDPLEVDWQTDTGLKIIYDTPRTVGADRICNAVSGFKKFGGPLIVVDFGTATTFDVISGQGEYSGGVIALGLKGASQELHRVAAKLPKVDMVFPSLIVGSTTEASIQSGIMWGTVALVDGIIDLIIKEKKWKKVKVIATGGMAALIAEKSRRIESVEPFLTLDGMKMIYHRHHRSGN